MVKHARRVLAGAAIAASIGLVTPGWSDARQQRSPKPAPERVDLSAPDGGAVDASAAIAALSPSGQVRVVIGLSKPAVAAKAGAAAEAGTTLSSAEAKATRTTAAREQASVAAAVAAAGGRVQRTFADAVNGMVAMVPRSAIAKLAATPGVVSVRPTREVHLANTNSNVSTGAPMVWESLGLTGAGQTIAIIDTGVDYLHADFGGAGNPADFTANDSTVIEPGTFPTAKVIGGQDFVGNDYDYGLDPVPDPDPLDCNGHGTHTAGTAAGQGVNTDGSTFTGPYTTASVSGLAIGPGSAPQASILAYKVFGCDGSTDDANVLAAIDAAYAAGATVISISLGSTFGDPTDVEAQAVNNVVRSGVVVIAAAGNEGHAAPYIVGSPSVASRGVSVAAIDASASELPAGVIDTTSIVLSNGNDGTLPVTGPVKVLSDGAGGIGLGCDAAEYAGVTAGDIVVTLRGVCARVDRATLGAAAGAAAVIMVNNGLDYPPYEGDIAGVTIPFLGGLDADSQAIMALDGQTITISQTTVPNPGFNAAASFTSGGPRSVDSALKPDLAAPGVSVLSAGVGLGTGGILESGTSMATPHVAGIAALVRQAHPRWHPVKVKAALMNRASASALTDYDPSNEGAGLANAPESVSATWGLMTVDGLDSLNYGYFQAGGPVCIQRSFRIFNDGSAAVTVNLSTDVTDGGYGESITFSQNTVTVQPRSNITVAATLTLDAAEVAALDDAAGAFDFIAGRIIATPTSGSVAVLPFAATPRGKSAISASGTAGAIRVTNSGIHAGTADVYAWQLRGDPANVSSPFEVRAVGIQQFDDPDPANTVMIFAIASTRRWSNPAQGYAEVAIDLNGDDTAEFYVVALDEGSLTGDPNGQLVSLITDADYNVLETLVPVAPFNGSVMELPLFRGYLPAGTASFRYSVYTEDLLDNTVDQTGWATWDMDHPPVSTGGWSELAPGASDSLAQTKNRTSSAWASTLGWMVVSVDDANGVAQADLLSKASVR